MTLSPPVPDRRRRTLLRAAALLLVGTLLTPTAASAAPGDNLVVNPGLEAVTGDQPDCFSREPLGDASDDTSYALIADAHGGTVAQRITVAGMEAGGNRKIVVAKTSACAPAVTPGSTYDFSLWYRSTSPDVSVELFYRDAATGVWGSGTVYKLASNTAAAWTLASFTTGAAPAGSDAVSFGLATFADGQIDTDDYSLALSDDVAPAEPPAPGAGPTVVEQVAIDGLVLPTAVELLPNGRVMVAEKAGAIQTFDNLLGGNPTEVLDIREATSSFEDFGLTAIAATGGFLYGAYTPNIAVAGTGPWGDVCDFNERVNAGGRPPEDVKGCPTTGRVSRWPVNPATGALGAEQIILGGPDDFCFQFTTHGVDALEVDGDDVLISAGEGANFTLPDYGQYGDNPCGDTPDRGGAFRSQTDTSYDGRILRFDPATMAVTVEAKGLRNPFRMSLNAGVLYSSDTGWFSWEEVNEVTLGGPVENFGWPCYEGPDPESQYFDKPICAELPRAEAKDPLYAYPHNLESASISALEFLDGTLYIGDYTRGFIAAVDPEAPGEFITPGEPGGPVTVMSRSEAAPVAVVDLKRTPAGGLLYVDIATGSVEAVVGGGTSGPPPTTVPTAEILLQEDPYLPGEEIAFEVLSSIRNRASYDWSVTLVTGCAGNGTGCDRTPVPFKLDGAAAGTFEGPAAPAPAVVEVSVTVTNSDTGETASDTASVERADDDTVPPGGAGVSRIAGADRIETAAEVSRQGYAPGVPVAYVARADDFPDALAAGPLAAATGGPILLTGTNELAAVTAAELARLTPAKVVVLGGTQAVSAEVEAAIAATHLTERLAGEDRFATAAAITGLLGPIDTVYVATGERFPDALVGGVAAGLSGGGILLTGATDAPDATTDLLAQLAPATIVLLGGEAAASAAVQAELAALGTTTRVFGATRYETAIAVSQSIHAATVGTAYVATGEAFPDALSIAPSAISDGGALLLTTGAELPAAVSDEVVRLDPAEAVVVGGEAAVSAAVEAALAALLAP